MKKTISIMMIIVILLSSVGIAESNLIEIKVNGENIVSEVDSIINDGLIVVPLRSILEALNFKITWDGKSRIITMEDENILAEIRVDNSKAKINDKDVKLNTPVAIINGRSLVSINFIEKIIGENVTWDKDNNIVSINKLESNRKENLTYSNMLDQKSQEEVRTAMEFAEIPSEEIDFFFEELNYYNETIEGTSLVEDGFKTIESLEPEYDLLKIQELWDSENPDFIGYNCRILTYDLMKDLINIGKIDTKNSDWLIFDDLAINTNPKEIFNEVQENEFKTFYSHVPTELTKDISVHLENVKRDWNEKEIEFTNEDKRSIIAVYFHDEFGYLFIGHMGILIPTENGELLFIEKLSFLEPYQAIKFQNRQEVNDYLMNKYDISWGQPTAKPFIMENENLIKGYREKPKDIEQ